MDSLLYGRLEETKNQLCESSLIILIYIQILKKCYFTLLGSHILLNITYPYVLTHLLTPK